MYCAHREWIQAEIDIAHELVRPIIGVELSGQERTPAEVQDAARIMVGWNTESIISAVRDVCPVVGPRLVHLSFTVLSNANQTVIDNAVDSVCLDWCRYAWNSYLIWTALPTEVIVSRIRQIPGL
jgi:hypothetical protein